MQLSPRHYQLVSTGLKPTDKQLISTDSGSHKKFEADHLVEALPDLVNQQFRAWYCQRFYALGKDEVLRLASIARADGKNPAKLFSYMLKNNNT